MSDKLIAQFQAARAAGVPLIAITTPDPGATLDQLAEALGDTRAVVEWDCVHGLRAYSGSARSKDLQKLDAQARASVTLDGPIAMNPIAVLSALEQQLSPKTIVFMLNGHRVLSDHGTPALQAVWNLRDAFKVTRRSLVMVGTSIKLPAELENDVVVLDEALPGPEALAHIITRQHENAQVAKPGPEELRQAVDAVAGLASFTAEQVVAMSMSRKGLDRSALWERKRQAIENTPGLSVWRGGETFDDLGGLDNVKGFIRRLLGGRRRFAGVVWIDEIDKAVGGSKGDTSGVSQDQHQMLLTYMQDHDVAGLMLIGHPGSGKSAISKAAGAEAGAPTIRFDLGGLKGMHVGESEGQIRNALKVVESVTQGRPLFIATCNAIDVLSPELRSRFKTGTFFFDLPTAEERATIWAICRRKYGINPADALPNDRDWTGREIDSCCTTAADTGMSLCEAAEFVVPMAVANANRVESLRNEADGRFISASYPRAYRKADAVARAVRRGETGRTFDS